MAHIPEKWMISFICLKEGTTESIRSNPHDSTCKHHITPGLNLEKIIIFAGSQLKLRLGGATSLSTGFPGH